MQTFKYNFFFLTGAKFEIREPQRERGRRRTKTVTNCVIDSYLPRYYIKYREIFGHRERKRRRLRANTAEEREKKKLK